MKAFRDTKLQCWLVCTALLRSCCAFITTSKGRPTARPVLGVAADHTTMDLAAAAVAQPTENVQILSKDPLVYTVDNFLSPEECQAYQDYVNHLSRPMTRSNPPQVSLDLAKLWPLPFLSLGAGLPPVIRLMEGDTSATINDILAVALPPIAGALVATFGLAFGVVLPLLRKQSEISSRTSVAVALNQPEDASFIRPLVDKLCRQSEHQWMKWEAPVVTRYDPGAIFARHGDASPRQGEEWKDLGGQRLITCICYLNTLEQGGGETYFDQLDIAVKPVAGRALFFFPADESTWKADDRTTHESLPPVEEDKWIVQFFGRAERVPPPLGLPDSFASS